MPRKPKPIPIERRPITGRQREFYDKMVELVTRTKAPASSLAMAREMGYASSTAARKMIDVLEMAGWLHPRNFGKHRRSPTAWPIDVPFHSGQKGTGQP